MTVLRIAHVALRVPDLDRSVEHAVQVLGLRLSERDASTAYLTCGVRHHELMLVAGDAVACDHIAVEALDRASFDALVTRIEAEPLEIVGRGRLESGVEDAIRFVAPGGHVVEVVHGVAQNEPATYDSVAPRPLRIEHITVKSSQKEALERTLIDVLGFRMSDRADRAASWLRASDEHHGVSVVDADIDALHHYAWQHDSFAALGRVGDHLMRHGRTFLWGPGHHGIGDNYFAYAYDDDGVVVEHSACIRRIDQDELHVPGMWPDEPLSVNRWGNPEPPAAFVDAATPLAEPAPVL